MGGVPIFSRIFWTFSGNASTEAAVSNSFIRIVNRRLGSVAKKMIIFFSIVWVSKQKHPHPGRFFQQQFGKYVLNMFKYVESVPHTLFRSATSQGQRQ